MILNIERIFHQEDFKNFAVQVERDFPLASGVNINNKNVTLKCKSAEVSFGLDV